MKFLHYKISLTTFQRTIAITLDKQANVRLMDSHNFQRYRSGNTHNYYGGRATRSPFIITAPSAGDWNLVIDLGGFPGTVKASVKLI